MSSKPVSVLVATTCVTTLISLRHIWSARAMNVSIELEIWPWHT